MRSIYGFGMLGQITYMATGVIESRSVQFGQSYAARPVAAVEEWISDGETGYVLLHSEAGRAVLRKVYDQRQRSRDRGPEVGDRPIMPGDPR